MPVWLISWIVFCAVGVAFPAILLLLAWRRGAAVNALTLIPLIATIVLALSMNHNVRCVLIGADYTRRLYATILAFAALTLTNAAFATIRKSWAVAVASGLLSLAWLFVGVVNSVV
ncbi:hypothetical protein [Occallatibacter riparius]|uniref:Uncharacterized protein n=1 Tax=Occallatibacter riparius TaxID=1002689 RepID=A0A9J7BR83_9BACT|nr:hypothetical protein [Occallatibacter riparius]UWZ85339.1 hypothetical protein MOP44_05220 [Occallatibacter riparius]